MKRIILLAIFSLSFSFAKAQCDTVYSVVDTMPQYPGGPRALMEYSLDSMSAGFSCLSELDFRPSRMAIKFTISSIGEVIDVKITKPNDIPNECRKKLESSYYNTKKWEPGKVNGKAVCVEFNYIVSCIKWQ